MAQRATAAPAGAGEQALLDRPAAPARARNRTLPPPQDLAPEIGRPHMLTIKAPNFQRAVFRIRGTSAYVQHKFSQKAREQIMATQAAGSQAKKGRRREARNFDLDYEQAQHRSKDGWHGIPAPAFRNAMISACKVVGFQMTKAKLCVFIEADGFDSDDGTPLVRILRGQPKKHEGPARNETGVIDIRVRPMWEPGWEADVRVQYDGDMFSVQDVANLLMRAGIQVGIGEGRPDSRNSPGVGWGTFEIIGEAEEGSGTSGGSAAAPRGKNGGRHGRS